MLGAPSRVGDLEIASRLLSPVLDAIGQETFLPGCSHFGERTLNTPGQEILAQAGQGGSICATEQVGSDREIELIDQILFEERAEQGGSSFASH